MRRWGLGVFIVFLFALSFSTTIYKYNKELRRWEKEIKEDVFVLPSAQRQTTGSVVEMNSYRGKGQWYYYMEYELGDGEKLFSFWAGQDTVVGTVTVWNDSEYLYVRVDISDEWNLEETHLNVLSEEPDGNQAPGQFPFKEEFDPPVSIYIFKVPLSFLFQNSFTRLNRLNNKYYILLHGVVSSSSGREETAWGGRFSQCLEIHLSGTKVTWFVKKPGVYVAKVLEVEANTYLSIYVNFPDPSNEKDSVDLKVAYGDEIPTEWFDDLSFLEDRFSLWQKINVPKTLSTNIYTSAGVITFTINNSKLYVDTSP
ncbi:MULTISPECIES: hypothetical protein [unclassified Thermotoga]|uniref:hypothetical protein n=1 Tax=unclassified Thermotoga TaxID=2631113 RepID=UPI000280E9E2|nr:MULTISPECIES: hypothetical protein [unclassified Thermotoga]AIY87207.1 hypothetical protein T2812B_08420 [Thermotoga sp. 2812B]EJX25294.1 hypothetical protein EMP_09109 [Thermotoga sp. EMP]